MEPQESRGIGAICCVGPSDRSKNVSSTLHQPHSSGGLREKPSSAFRGLIAGPIQSVAELPLVALITVNILWFPVRSRSWRFGSYPQTRGRDRFSRERIWKPVQHPHVVGGGRSAISRCEQSQRSGLESNAALTPPKRDFWSAPNNGHRQTEPACLKGANRRRGTALRPLRPYSVPMRQD